MRAIWSKFIPTSRTRTNSASTRSWKTSRGSTSSDERLSTLLGLWQSRSTSLTRRSYHLNRGSWPKRKSINKVSIITCKRLQEWKWSKNPTSTPSTSTSNQKLTVCRIDLDHLQDSPRALPRRLLQGVLLAKSIRSHRPRLIVNLALSVPRLRLR